MKNIVLALFALLFFTTAKANLIPNFHTVDKGKLYRSAQLSKKQFRKYVKKHGIKTIINLRGESSSDWYQDEIVVSRELGVEHFDISMSAKRLPHRKDLIKLLDLYKSAQRPILIHCQGGADRTGEASAMYKIDYMGASKKEALKMLRIKYFHLKKRFPAKRYFIKKIYQGEQWARENYFPCLNNYNYASCN